jgi:uncharacterized protein (TIGR02118 family)
MSNETPITVCVLYPMNTAGRFDLEYYMAKHIPMVQARWQPLGLTGFQILRGTPGPDGVVPAFRLIALVSFTSMAAFKTASAQHAAEIFGDIPNFTDAKPVVQISEMVH